jgi:phage regulator Rha-like protein
LWHRFSSRKAPRKKKASVPLVGSRATLAKPVVQGLFLSHNFMLPTKTSDTITSREIAELTGKAHAHIMRDIRVMEEAWEKVNGSKFGLVEYLDAKGEKRPQYVLTKTECLYIATKFNDEARARLVLRWEELEKERQAQLPKTFAQALRLAAEQQELIEAQAAQVQSLEQSLDVSEQWISIVRAAKELGVKETVFNWRVLKDYSLANGIEVKTAPCPRFVTKKLYHVSVFRKCYPDLYRAELLKNP